MRIFNTSVFLFFTCLAFGQNVNRYYPSLQKIFTSESDKKISKDYKYYDNWIRNNSQSVFYKNLQTSLSNNGDSSFLSLDLIFKNQNTFKLGNSGIELIFNKDKSDFSSPIPIQMQDHYRILSYLRNFNPNEYDPKNLKQKFDLGLSIFNLSEETIVNVFLDDFVNDNKNDKLTAVQQMITDLKNEAKINISVDKTKDKNIAEIIASQIQKQTKRLGSDVLYDIYIKSFDKDREESNFRVFFRKITNEDADLYIDAVVAYNAEITIPGNELSIIIPKNTLKIINPKSSSKNNIEINPRQIEMKVINTTEKKCIEFTAILKENNDQTEFNILNEIKFNHHPFISDSKRSLTNFKISEAEKIIFSIYENEIIVNMIMKKRNDYTNNFTVMKQPFNMN